MHRAGGPSPIFFLPLQLGGWGPSFTSAAMAALPLLFSFSSAGDAATATTAFPDVSANCRRHVLQWTRSYSAPMLHLLAVRPRLRPPLPPLRCALCPEPRQALSSSPPSDPFARARLSGSNRPGCEAAGGDGGGGEDERAYGGGDNSGGNNGRKGGGNGGGGRGWWGSFGREGWRGRWQWWGGEANWVSFCLTNGAVAAVLPLLCLSWLGLSQLPSSALARSTEGGGFSAWEVRGGKWSRLEPDPSGEGFVVIVSGGKESQVGGDGVGKRFVPFRLLRFCWRQLQEVVVRLMLPEGYPESVTSDYLEYSIWRGIQGIASQVSGVLSTQVRLLLAVLPFLVPHAHLLFV